MKSGPLSVSVLKSLPRSIVDRSGQALAEFAIVLPVLLLIVFGIIEFGLAYRTFQIVTNSAREGARVAVVPSSDSQDTTQAVRDRLAGAGLDISEPGLSIVLRCNGVDGEICTNSGDPTEVEVGYPYRFFVLGPIANLVCGGGCGQNFGEVQLQTTSVMRTE